MLNATFFSTKANHPKYARSRPINVGIPSAHLLRPNELPCINFVELLFVCNTKPHFQAVLLFPALLRIWLYVRCSDTKLVYSLVIKLLSFVGDEFN